MTLLVALFGAAGAAARYLVDHAIRSRFPTRFPVATTVVNLTGSFLLGLLVGVGLTGDWRVLAGVGFCGGYTTFSTAMVETLALPGTRERALNLVGMFAGCLLAVAAGAGLGHLAANLPTG
ncbi:CrcB family protein [Nonomuraea sp. NPDC050310]|uniref:fluoride efflux transporter FluC n=1 Tax=Nonomuraea sp. NPDC050310 TaxID=3154935 RepID=UPI0033DABD12